MSQQTFTASPPTASQFPITFNLAGQWRPGIRTIEVDNATALTLTVVADGAVIRTVPPYVPRFNVNTGGGWQSIQIKSNGAAIQTTDTLTIIVYDQLVVPPLLPSFGPAAWGGGAIPNSLVAVNPGDAFAAWQVQQLINLLTGVMTGQAVTLDSTVLPVLSLQGTGRQIILVDTTNGQATPNKYIQSAGGNLEFVNSTNTIVLWEMMDDGNVTMFCQSTPGLTIRNTGQHIVLVDTTNGQSTPNKYIQSAAGELQFVNSTNTVVLVHLTDAGRLTVPSTGASGKPLLNLVPVSPPVQTLVSGTGNTGLIQLPVSGLPNSAVYADFFAEGSMSAGGAISFYGPNGLASPQSGTMLNVGTVATAPPLGFAMAPSSAGHVGYQVSGVTGAWSFTLTLNGYFEPS